VNCCELPSFVRQDHFCRFSTLRPAFLLTRCRLEFNFASAPQRSNAPSTGAVRVPFVNLLERCTTNYYGVVLKKTGCWPLWVEKVPDIFTAISRKRGNFGELENVSFLWCDTASNAVDTNIHKGRF